MTRTVDKKQSGVWYLDFCISKHIFNSQDTFTDLWVKTYEFVTAWKDIIWSEQVEIITLLLKNSSELIISNIAYAPKYDSNFISLG